MLENSRQNKIYSKWMIAAVVVVISRLQQILGKHIRWNRHQYSNRLQADFTSSWADFQVCKNMLHVHFYSVTHSTFISIFAGDGF